MKTAIGLAFLVSTLSLNGWAEEIDYDKRNMHIFCTAHLTIMSESLDVASEQSDALAYLSGMHRDEAGKLGATEQHFEDVSGYLEKTRRDNQQKWKQLSYQSKQVCLPDV